MKKFSNMFNKISASVVIIAFVFSLIGLSGPSSALAATNPNLGAAATFSVLASTAITGTTLTALDGISGNVAMNSSGASIGALTPAMVAGTIYATDLAAPSEGTIAASPYPTVQADASTARAAILPGGGLADEGGLAVPLELGGVTRGPGVYTIAGNATLSGVLTLDGPGTYIFRNGPGFNLTSAIGGSINFINGARACDLFWGVGTSAEIGSPTFAGTILSSTGVHFTAAGTTLNGRALAVGADVTLNTTDISGPTCAATTGTLHVIKQVVGGTASAADFSLSVKLDGTTNVTGSPAAGTATPGTSYSLVPGTYVVSEGANGSYSQSFSGDCNSSGSVTLAISDDKTCTIINTFPTSSGGVSSFTSLGTINVVKRVINDNGRTKTIEDFPLFVNDTPVVSGVTNTFATSGATTYTVTETADPNYTQTFSGDCDANGVIILSQDQNRFCIITNDDIGTPVVVPPVPPLIDVVKVPNPLSLPNGAGSVEYTYTLKNIGTVPVTDITMVGDTCSPINLASGDTNSNDQLEVSETWTYRCTTTLTATHTNTVVATGWANGLTATDIASATVVVGVPIVPPLIHITKVPSPLTLLAGGGMVTYTKKVTNPGTVALNNITISDDKCSDVKYVSGDTNGDTKLDPNETWTYTCKTNLTKTTTNTASVSGEANGMTARDFAIATVTVATIAPTLPNTGVNADTILWNVSILFGAFAIVSGLFVVFTKKRTL